jgi:ABC-type branched-subunit amino acid transport system substrate-binding protein
LVTEIHAVKPRYLVLLGYPELTRDVLEELKERAATPEQQMSNYTFITPDADLTDDLIAFGSNIYVTSPTNPERSVGCGSDLGKALSKAIQVKKKGRDPTEESYAFDAVLILATAVQDCAKPSRTLDRRCVMEYLEKPTPFAGACEEYHIDMGERQNARYYVYSICGNKFRPRWSVVAEEKELQDDSNWCKLSSH